MEQLLTIIIPTYNRVDSIKQILSKLTYENSRFLRVEIHDSSTNDLVEKEIEKIINDDPREKEILFYYKYSSDLFVDDKNMQAFKNCTTKYAFLLGDGWVVDFSKLSEIFLDNSKKDFDVLCLLHEKGFHQFENYPKNNTLDTKTFFSEYLWYVTLYSSCIVKTNIFNYENTDEIYSLYKNSDFFFPCMIFNRLSVIDNPNIIIVKDDYIIPGNFKIASGWVLSGDMLKIWTYKFFTAILKLPDYYDNKEEIIRKCGIQSEKYSFVNLLRYRYFGNITFSKLKEYKTYINKVTNKYMTMFFMCFIPRWILKPFYFYIRKNRQKKKRSN